MNFIELLYTFILLVILIKVFFNCICSSYLPNNIVNGGSDFSSIYTIE